MTFRPALRGPFAYLAGLAIGLAALAIGGVPSMLTTHGTDLAYVWAGPRTVLDGGDPYDPVSWRDSVARLGTPQHLSPAVYSYPPVVAMALLPMAALPLEVVALLWIYGSLAAAAVTLGVLLRETLPDSPVAHGFAGLALLASQPAAQALFNGQWAFWLVAVVCGLVLLLRRRQAAAAGALAAALLVKPQLFVLFLPALLLHAFATGRGRAGVAVAVVAGSLTAASVLHRPEAWTAWAGAIGAVAQQSRIANAMTAAGDLLGLPGRVLAVGAIVVAALASLARFGPASGVWVGGALALSLAAAPYARSYDQPLLVAALVVAAGGIADQGRPRAALALVVLGSVTVVALSWLLRIFVAGPARSEAVLGLVPVVVATLILSLAWGRGARTAA